MMSIEDQNTSLSSSSNSQENELNQERLSTTSVESDVVPNQELPEIYIDQTPSLISSHKLSRSSLNIPSTMPDQNTNLSSSSNSQENELNQERLSTTSVESDVVPNQELPEIYIDQTPSLIRSRKLSISSPNIPSIMSDTTTKNASRSHKRRWGVDNLHSIITSESNQSDFKLKRSKHSSNALSSNSLCCDHMLSMSDYCAKLETNTENGLSQVEAERRLTVNGPNLLTEKKTIPAWLLFIKELFTGFGPLYWAAAILCIIAYEPLGGSNPSLYNLALGLILIGVLFLSSIFRFVQLQTASGLMNKFLQMMPHNTRVLRDGRWIEIESKLLVVGDVISLTGGDKLPADVRAIEVNGAKIDKSNLTGETKPVKITVEGTDNDINETSNVGFLGTNLVEGTLKAIVFSCGDHTAMGQLAELSVTAERNMTTLEKDIYYFTILVAALAISVCILISLYWRFYLSIYYPDFMTLPLLLATCTGVMVAFVPDGLALSVTATLMIVAKSMRNVNVLVKDLNIIDTLGATTIICSDKTGTITQNKMALSHVWMLDSKRRRTSVLSLKGNQELCGSLDMLNTGSNQGSGWLTFVLGMCGLCNNATLDEETGNIIGSSTESALLAAAQSAMKIKTLRDAFPVTSQIPFDSARKYQINVHRFSREVSHQLITDECINALEMQTKGAKKIAIVKGGSEIILDMCTSCLCGSRIIPFTESLKESALEAMQTLAATGERVLGMSYCLFEDADIDAEQHEDMIKRNCTFVSLLSLIDPPRNGVLEAVNKCHTAGIKVAMVTGDHPATAAAIARKVNIFSTGRPPVHISDLRESLNKHESNNKNTLPAVDPDQPIVVLGRELSDLTDDEWRLLMNHREFVFARTTPENKMDIAKHFQDRGEIVAATGDGVNDAAALKKANIGIAMGIMGSEISKDAANVILMDDNFASIVKGIEAGRLLFDNLRKVVCYLLPAGSFSEIIPVLVNTFLGIPLPLSAFLMIVICVATDVIGSLGMVHETSEADIMRRKPRKANKQHLVDYKVLLYTYFEIGVLESCIAFFMFFLTMYLAGGCYPNELIFAFQWGVPPTNLEANSTNVTNFTTTAIYTTTNNDFNYCGLDYNGQNNLLNIGQTAFFASLVICQCWNLMTSRTRKASVFKQKLRHALLLNIYGEISIIFYISFIPFFNNYLATGPIDYYNFLIPAAAGVILLGVEEARKAYNRRYRQSWLAKIAW